MTLSKYLEEIRQAQEIVTERFEQGENNHRDFDESFLHGVSDIFAIIYMKILRVDGRYQGGDVESILEELHDILNYTAFAAAMVRPEIDQIRQDRLIDENTY